MPNTKTWPSTYRPKLWLTLTLHFLWIGGFVFFNVWVLPVLVRSLEIPLLVTSAVAYLITYVLVFWIMTGVISGQENATALVRLKGATRKGIVTTRKSLAKFAGDPEAFAKRERRLSFVRRFVDFGCQWKMRRVLGPTAPRERTYYWYKGIEDVENGERAHFIHVGPIPDEVTTGQPFEVVYSDDGKFAMLASEHARLLATLALEQRKSQRRE